VWKKEPLKTATNFTIKKVLENNYMMQVIKDLQDQSENEIYLILSNKNKVDNMNNNNRQDLQKLQ
jgi:hypothetical protein